MVRNAKAVNNLLSFIPKIHTISFCLETRKLLPVMGDHTQLIRG
jgi:hypothetical protein